MITTDKQQSCDMQQTHDVQLNMTVRNGAEKIERSGLLCFRNDGVHVVLLDVLSLIGGEVISLTLILPHFMAEY